MEWMTLRRYAPGWPRSGAIGWAIQKKKVCMSPSIIDKNDKTQKIPLAKNRLVFLLGMARKLLARQEAASTEALLTQPRRSFNI